MHPEVKETLQQLIQKVGEDITATQKELSTANKFATPPKKTKEMGKNQAVVYDSETVEMYKNKQQFLRGQLTVMTAYKKKLEEMIKD